MRAQDIIALPTGEFTFPLDYDYPGQTGVVVAYAIRHSGGIFLFDTGFAPAGPELDEFYLRWDVRPRDLDDVFAEAGIDAREITAIANCHLHLDHSGQNSRFPGTPIYVQGAEWAAAHEPDYTYLPSVDFPGATYVEIDGEAEPLPGVRIFRPRAIPQAISRSWSRARTACCCSPARRSTAAVNGSGSGTPGRAPARPGTAPRTTARSTG